MLYLPMSVGSSDVLSVLSQSPTQWTQLKTQCPALRNNVSFQWPAWTVQGADWRVMMQKHTKMLTPNKCHWFALRCKVFVKELKSYRPLSFINNKVRNDLILWSSRLMAFKGNFNVCSFIYWNCSLIQVWRWN